ncbi:Gfo/Idh/MocA family protein [Acidobacteriota bacterium]
MCSKKTKELPGEPLRLGIIGCGHWGANYIRNFHNLPEAKVVGCCDVNEKCLDVIRQDYPLFRFTTDPDDILNDGEISGVVVATTAETHYELVNKALEKGKHVLAEKPLTLDPAQALALQQLAQAQKSVLMVDHTFLYNPAVIRLRRLVEEGHLGTLYYMIARRTHLGLIRKDVNAIWDLCPHDVSIFNHAINALPTRVSAVGTSFLSDHAEDFAFIALTYPQGVIGHIFVSWVDSNKTREVALVGSRSRVVFNDLDNLERVKIFHKGISIDKPYSNFGEFQLLQRDGDIVSPKIDMVEPLKVVCKEFLRCVTEQSQPLSDSVCGWEVVKIVHAIDRSIKADGMPQDIDWTDHPRRSASGAVV